MNLILKNRNFCLLWVGQIISQMGDWLNSLAIPLLIMRLTNSPIAISFYFISRFLPTMLFSSFTGALVDKFNRKKVMIFADFIRFAIYMLYPFVTNVYQVYVLAFCATILTQMFEPAKSAIIPNLVSEDELLTANSISSSTSSFMRLIGTAVGGVLIAAISLKITFYLNAITFVFSAIALFFITLPKRVGEKVEGSEGEESIFANVNEGFKTIIRERALFTLVAMDALSIIGYGFLNILLPVFTTQVISKSESTFGLIMSFFGAGLFFGSILIKNLSKKRSLPLLWCIGLTIAGCTQILFGLSATVVLAVIFIFIAGFGDALQVVSYATLTQKIVPDQLRGRVFSIAGAINSGALLIGMGSTGFLLEIFSARNLMLFSGSLVLLSGLLSFVVFRNVLIHPKVQAEAA